MTVNFANIDNLTIPAMHEATAAQVLETIEDIIAADAIEDTWACLTEFCAQMGFPRLFYGFTNFRTEQSFGAAEDFLLLSNACERYVKPFVEGEMFRKAPMVRWANTHTGVQSWQMIADEIAQGKLTDEELSVVAFNKEHGVTSGYTISFQENSTRNRGALAFIGPKGAAQSVADEIWALHGRVLQMVANVAHLKITRLPHYGTRRHLTERQREVLAWVGDGKTNQDIATILGLTSATVEKHLRLAREVLDVETTAQAVLKAAVQNQIFAIKP
ncbi:hypothetical protein ACMU_07720 [Actibacterium mucosum KCTC 23349]|uniref:HTH luxR-type domain-containing protein n=1 Tax=Actibacterium mucosum KCTC 23349 TaxID=1454373 RepID=A0A037ZMN7_9RHOB|nr:autoinducer binding domain-containing protein [Actibacterium mucosum]KAJ56818.1 hypothetical protein ACMU_07720 [Actibacterium mucosum KCTC 23349]